MIRRVGPAAVLLVLAVVLALFARDTWHWSRAMRDADARGALGYVAPAAWRAHTTLPARFSRGLLGLDDDIEFRQAAMDALFQSARVPNAKQQKERAILESDLARISRADSDPVRASSAADDLGALLYFDPPSPEQAKNPYEDPTQAASAGLQTPTQKATTEFELAVRLDPSNVTAQRNLEVLLRIAPAKGNQQQTRVGAGEHLGTKGSGSRQPGHGY
jgi:hypothetical protein